MSNRLNLVGKWRVFDFELESGANRFTTKNSHIIVIDRNDGLRDELATSFGFDAASECRPRNIALLIDGHRNVSVVTRCDQSGIAAAEIVRMLNKTGFKGKLLFVCDAQTVPLHLTRRLKNLAIDFDLSTTTVPDLGNAPKMTTDPSTNHILSSALG